MSTTHLNNSKPKLRARAAARVATLLLAISASLLPAPTRAAEIEPNAKALEALTKAFAAQDAKDWSGAKTLSEKQPAVVRDLVQWRYVSSQDSGATFDEIDAFLGAHANWPGRFQIVQRGEEALLTNALVDTKGPAWFKARPPRTSAGCLAWAKFQFAHEQKPDALSGIRRCWLARTLTLADYQDWTSGTQMTLPEADHLARADDALWNRSVSGARELLPLLSAKAQVAVDARVKLQSGNAIDLDDVLDEAPSPAWAASLIYDQAVQQRKAGKTEEAWALLMKADNTGALPQSYSQAWWLEHNLQARDARDAGEHDTAYKLASRTHLSANNNVVAYLDAEFLSGWIALRNLDEPKKALTHFQNLEAAAKSPITHARADYWKALALKALDEEAKARQALADAAAAPTAFYGRLALEMLKDAPPPASRTPNPSATAAGEDIEQLIQAVAVLLRIADNRRANVFANAAIDVCQSAACATTLSARLSRLGNNYGAVRSAKKAQTLGLSRPDQLYPLIDLPPACTTAGVPPALILALIRQESEFDPAAVSSANARGLLQLLPSTAQEVARRNALPYAGADDLHKPEINLAIGCYHVKDLLDALGGSWVLTIAGYNAGKARVLAWTTTHGDLRDDAKVDVIDWIEAIPFDETRNYVMRVLENHLAYKARRGEPLNPQELNQSLRRVR
ncbi:MAG: lytic transglycosylase domain-containing protein [Alphaproteobacteria bacterium]|nr:lytic transglycosylase domain-containing protein [Alphaproteobacteria bacterium]